MKRAALLALLMLAGASAAQAQDFKGELDLESAYAGNGEDSLAAWIGEQNRFDQTLRFRLMWDKQIASGWSIDATWLAQLDHGGETALQNKERQAFPGLFTDPEQTALLDLQANMVDDGESRLTQRIDRLALTYSGEHVVVKAGRQALTWGGGLVFRPFDLFNPFAPNATYTRYKPGADMLYGQYLFDSGSDLQAVFVPRRDPLTDKVDLDHSSTGVKWQGFLGEDQGLGVDVLLARDYQDDVFGLGLNGSLGGATWTVQAMGTRIDALDEVKPTFLANAQYAWVWRGKNVNAYVEGFYNGLGVGGSQNDIATLPVYLAQRLARGELFTVSQTYLTAGANVQWSPLLTLKPLLIANADDGSVLAVGQAEYSLSQNTALNLGFQTGFGKSGTEYGGMELAPATGIYNPPANRIWARYSWYF